MRETRPRSAFPRGAAPTPGGPHRRRRERRREARALPEQSTTGAGNRASPPQPARASALLQHLARGFFPPEGFSRPHFPPVTTGLLNSVPLRTLSFSFKGIHIFSRLPGTVRKRDCILPFFLRFVSPSAALNAQKMVNKDLFYSRAFFGRFLMYSISWRRQCLTRWRWRGRWPSRRVTLDVALKLTIHFPLRCDYREE